MVEDREVQRALGESAQVGGLLLKREGEELAKAQAQARRLIRSAYELPERRTFCEAEREACIDCYRLNKRDPLKCSTTVAAFSECATRAHRAL